MDGRVYRTRTGIAWTKIMEDRKKYDEEHPVGKWLAIFCDESIIPVAFSLYYLGSIFYAKYSPECGGYVFRK